MEKLTTEQIQSKLSSLKGWSVNNNELKISYKLKSFMEELPNIQFVRMTGSGSSLIGYFLTKNSAIKGVKLFKKKYKNYWCITSKTI